MNIPLQLDNVYKILAPETARLPLVFDSPHSGSTYPDDFKYCCDLEMLRRAEDPHVEDLYSNVTKYGASLLMALFPRNYVDVNRAIDDIDEEILCDPWHSPLKPSVKSAAGHGIIHRLIKADYPIYDRKLSLPEVQQRIDGFYLPYHQALKSLLDESYEKFGQVWHIDCHSMSSLAAKEGSAFQRAFGEADFVLGDRDGTTCDPRFTIAIRDFLGSLGYKVFVNSPYKGAEIVQRYSNPPNGRHSLQIEVNKALYMNEETFEKGNNYNQLKDNIGKLVGFISSWVSHQPRLAAQLNQRHQSIDFA